MQRVIEKTVALAGITGPTTYDIDLDTVEILSIEAVIDVNTPSAGVFTAAVTDIITDVAHGFPTGLKGQASTTTTLPAGLSLATDYFVIALTADTYSLATSYALALAGTAVDITDTGTGTHTFTPTALAGGTIQLQKSNDDSTYLIEGSATNITADATVFLEKDRPGFKWARVAITCTAGSMDVSLIIVGKT